MIYGHETLDQIHARLMQRAVERSVALVAYQSNHEGALCDRIGARDFDGLLVNGGAYTHTSLALFDAIRAVSVPCVEVHLSNPEAREEYRRVSMIAPACIGKVSGFGGNSYILGLDGLLAHMQAGKHVGG
jgi:3-dehydroquinate dehydratase II